MQSSKNESQRTQEGESKMRLEEGRAQQATGRKPEPTARGKFVLGSDFVWGRELTGLFTGSRLMG